MTGKERAGGTVVPVFQPGYRSTVLSLRSSQSRLSGRGLQGRRQPGWEVGCHPKAQKKRKKCQMCNVQTQTDLNIKLEVPKAQPVFLSSEADMCFNSKQTHFFQHTTLSGLNLIKTWPLEIFFFVSGQKCCFQCFSPKSKVPRS